MNYLPIAARRWLWTAVQVGLLLAVTSCERTPTQVWHLANIKGNLPDLRFSLESKTEHTVTAADFRGNVVLLFFGYLHCPDVCPMTMARLAGVIRGLGDAAADVRVLFVSVDPKRDTPDQVNAYARTFSPEAVGATGSSDEIEALAKRYRVAYQALPSDRFGNYEVMHSKAVYVFDQQGRVRLMISDTNSPQEITHDLQQLLRPAP